MSAGKSFRLVASLFACAVLSTPAHAVFRAYLASDGLDTNPCTLVAPCRLLPAALAAVDDGGEIWMLDSANYNTATVNIGKSVSILAVPGAIGSILGTSGPAVSITAAGLQVALRNLVIIAQAGGSATHGISMTGASNLSVEHCLIANMPSHGISVVGTGKLKVAHSILRYNGDYAVYAQNGPRVEVTSSQVLAGLGGAGGINAYATGNSTTVVTVSDSVFSGNSPGGHAIYGFATISTGIIRIAVTRSTLEGFTYGLRCETTDVGSAELSVSASTITNNSLGWRVNGIDAVIYTLGNNHFTNNFSNNGSMTATPLM